MSRLTVTANTTAGDRIICYSPTMITTNGIWKGDNPLDFSLPLFVLQLTLVVALTRLFTCILKPLRQPKVVAEILAGIVLGPSVMGRYKPFSNEVFPTRGVLILETMANIGLLYFLFLVGVEMDLAVIRRTGKKAVSIAIGGMILPFLIGCSYSSIKLSVSEYPNPKATPQGVLVLFLGISLALTAFPVLARILAENKLLNTELGRVAMSSALVNDICAWILLAVTIAIAETNIESYSSIWVILSGVTFVATCVFVIRPLIKWMIQRTPEGENFSNFYICLLLTGVMVFGFITDAIGTHSVFGAFVFGLIIPNGPLGAALVEKLEDFVSGLLLPLYFATSGLKTDVTQIKDLGTWIRLTILVFLACLGKIFGTAAVARFYNMGIREGITLGLLMNTKGLVEMIILNVGKDQQVLDDEIFALMVVSAVFMTGIITPIVTTIYKPLRKFLPYKRTVQRSKPDEELRLLTCVHTPRNVPTIINLIEATHPSKRSPIWVYVLHLVELTGRASAMLIVHTTRKIGNPALNRTQAQSEHIINAFVSYQQHAANVSIQPLTTISPYSSMHEDICNLAEDKRASFIILPFHKQQTVDGGMEAPNPAFRTVNQNVLANAPCSVGILVDRGLSGSTRMTPKKVSHQVIVLFFGGPDDREALAYAWRMSEHPGITLNVMRFINGDNTITTITTRTESIHDNDDQRELTTIMDTDRQKQLDEEYINDFKTRTAHDESITCSELAVNNVEQTVAAIRSINTIHDLYIVGRGHGTNSPLTAGLTEWSECPELGPIGDLLASSDFASNVSVLVVQQHVGEDTFVEEVSTLDTPTAKMFDHDEGFDIRDDYHPPLQHHMR
ncbi:hypothetical protein Droror1_Dr00021934 [Drosera rotundifolia]